MHEGIQNISTERLKPSQVQFYALKATSTLNLVKFHIWSSFKNESDHV